MILSRNLEPIRLSYEKAESLFKKLSEAKKEGNEITRVISFQNFAIGCVENDLFSLSAQQDFLQIKDKTQCYELLGTKEQIEDKIRIIEERLKVVGKYDYYNKIWIEPIKNLLKEDYKSIANVLLIKQKLIEAESTRVFTE